MNNSELKVPAVLDANLSEKLAHDLLGHLHGLGGAGDAERFLHRGLRGVLDDDNLGSAEGLQPVDVLALLADY